MREQKITLGEMRESGPTRLVVFCGDYSCAHSVIGTDRWPDHVRLGVGDGERAELAIKGAAGKRLTYVNQTKRDLSRLARRFLRWQAKHNPQPKPKPRFVKYWRTR
jgi:hypothetical protein